MYSKKNNRKKQKFSIKDKADKLRLLPSNISAKRQLGQNFLIDNNIINKIIASCDLKATDTVLEIGPGLGALTNHIAPRVKEVIAIETDGGLFEELKTRISHQNVNCILADFLKFNIHSLPKNIKVIGNLPYYISSPIIAKVLESKDQFSSLYMTIQLELGNRIMAKVNTKDYSVFSLFVQYHADCKLLFKIKNVSFKPKPKVHSCFMSLSIRKKPIFIPNNEALLWQAIRQAFSQRRKNILNSLSKIIDKDELLPVLASLKINPQSRAENLSIKDFVALTDIINQKVKR